jgi:hypothetical protein
VGKILDKPGDLLDVHLENSWCVHSMRIKCESPLFVFLDGLRTIPASETEVTTGFEYNYHDLDVP